MNLNPIRFIFLCSALCISTVAANAHVQRQPRTVSLVAVGDILLADSIEGLMRRKGVDYPFSGTQAVTRSADIAFGNLECSVSLAGSPIPKQFNFRAHPNRLKALVNAGFDVVSLANNHTWDYGRIALADTARYVRRAKIVGVGAGANRAVAHRLRIIEKNGVRIGFLAYLGLLPALIPESETEPSVAMGSVETIREEAKVARPQVDVLIVSLHAGKERAPNAMPRQKSFARAAIDGGADLVIGHHPHVVQPMVKYKGKSICYSLGNFVFSTSGRGTGALLEATLHRNGKVEARLRGLSLAGGRPTLKD